MTAGGKVLYIDDDPGVRRLAQRDLQRRGYVVVLAGSGLEGVEKARESEFDLIAVDHYMPGRDGLETLALLRDLPRTPPVVYVTGSEESRVAVAALKAGAADYVVKTPDNSFFDLLDAAFRQALDQVRLLEEKESAETRLRATNDRLQAMLHEVNHRVANSLQLVSAFVHLQAATVADEAARAALESTKQRIAAIAQVHRRLYSVSDVERVDMRDYLGALAEELEQTWSTPSSPRRVRVDAAPVRLRTDRAVSVGIIVTELVSNACKYAYPNGAAGEVRVTLRPADNGHFKLNVQDDGPGLLAGEAPKGTGLGARLIAAMAASLQSEVVFDDIASGVSATLHAAC
jgi:two-component sensor histidine kinase